MGSQQFEALLKALKQILEEVKEINNHLKHERKLSLLEEFPDSD